MGQGTEPGQGAAMPCPAPGKRFRGVWAIPAQTRRFSSALFPSVAALQTLGEDSDPSIRSLIAQTVLMLGSLMEQPRSGRTLRALCC